jgi:hypothetical protein
VLLTGAQECVTPPIPTYALGSYRASTSITPLSVTGVQQEILDLGVLRNQVAHAQSVVFVNHSLTTFYDTQPNLVTLAIPGREYLSNQVEMGGAAATFVAGTPWGVPATGTAVDVIPFTPTQATYFSGSDNFAADPLATLSLDWNKQFAAVWPFQDPLQLLLSAVPLESGAWPSESTGTWASASAGSREVDTESATFVELHLDAVPGLRAHLLRLINRRRSKLRRVLKRRQTVSVRLSRPARRSLTLVLLAVSRRYGRRSESDDHTLPAHRSTSVIGGEPALSH